MKAIVAAALIVSAAGARAADFSPDSWPIEAKRSAETQELQGWAPAAPRLVQGPGGVIAATVSPIAVQAGLAILRKGGTAADAAASVALTQVATQLGSVVSYAGIMTVVYYDAKTGTVSSLDAGFGTWRKETDPASIPPSDISALTGGTPPEISEGLGRQVLVPGFMAGIEALQKRFGRYSLAQSLQPAIWYAKNGMTVSPTLAALFQMRRKQFERTDAGRAFLSQSGRAVPLAGDVFKQPQLAATLTAVARDGARTMYTGAWAKDFVAAVRRDGGKADLADLAAYRPVWSDAAKTKVFGHTVYTNGGASLAPYQFLTALNAAEALKLDARGPYWRDADTLHVLTELGAVTAGAPVIHPAVAKIMTDRGIDPSRGGSCRRLMRKHWPTRCRDCSRRPIRQIIIPTPLSSSTGTATSR